MISQPVKTGLIGFGLSGRVFHAPFIQFAEEFELAAIAQQTKDTAKALYPGVSITRSLQEIVDDPSIELVIVAAPNEFHFEMTRLALQAGKHVIVEKPFSPTLAETKELIQLAEEKNLHLFVFHNRRWDGDFMTLKHVIQKGLLGDIVEYEARYNRYKPDLNPKPWKEKVGPASGILYDLGTHIIDQAVCLFGAPETVTARLYRQRKGTKIDDSFDVRLDYPTLKATLKSTLLAKDSGPRYLIYGQKGSFVKAGIDPQEDDMQAGISLNSKEWGLESPKNWGILNTSFNNLNFQGTIETLPGNYMGFYKNVYEVIREAKPYAIDPHSAQITTAIIEAAVQSHDQGRSIPLDSL